MSARSIQPTYPIFTDIDGQPLEDGYVWIGAANLDPQNNPINVYWDAALTLPAAQPIRTLAGYPANNGTPARLYVNSDYSIRVMNKNGSTVYSAPAATERYGNVITLSDIDFTQSGAGAVERTAQDKMRDSVSRADYDSDANFDTARTALTSRIDQKVRASGGSFDRLLSAKMGELLSIKDFGAIGDGVANDTAAITLAVSYMTSTGNSVYVPPGTYLTDPFSINSQVYAGQANLIGSDRERCIIKRKVSGAGAFITYGSATGTVFQSGVGFENMTIDGLDTTSGDTFVGYDVVRSQFKNVRFKGGSVACHLYGGISVSFYSCLFDMAAIGLRIEKFTSAAGGGWSNIIRVIGGEIVDNTSWGVYFDHGRALILRDVEVEGNGTTLGASQGGIYIGGNVGEEVVSTDTFNIALVASGCWFEANRGVADISLNNGLNSITDSTFFSTSAMVTNDVVINGGRYLLRNVNMSMSKTANVLENSGTVAGNIIESSDISNISASSSKTTIYSNNKINTRGGVVPVVAGFSIPFEQFGTGNTTAGSTTAVTFPVAYAAAPKVFAQVMNGDTSTDINHIVISSVTATGFNVRSLRVSNGSSAISSVVSGYEWRAIGTL